MSSNIWTLEPDPIKNNWLEKLNEWEQKFRGSIDWEVTVSTVKGNHKLWKATPTIRGIRMADCMGEGSSVKVAQNNAAKLLSDNGRLVRSDCS
ncbi:hypothetical protein OPQ81_000175 [Rhizoctonia solani]|nr:hypothetical protein OPQ81_000175 [Rhizoctonia solani]